jgi:osmoprotectant transport system substrate-binding protein
MKKIITILVVLAVTIAVFGCDAKVTEKNKKGDITVATMIDSEGAVLGSMMVALLKEDGFNVIDKTEFGTPEILRQALVSGEVDLVLDYTGSGQYYHEGNNADEWSDATKGYELTKKLDKEVNNIIWLTPANANNTEGLAVKKEFAEANKIATMEDFAKYVNGGGKTKLICSSAFAENIKGLRGLEEAYGFKLSSDQLVILASGNTAEMLKALTETKDGINVSLVYGTDGALDKMNLFVIADPKSIPPVYLPTPVLRGELYQKNPEIETLLKPLFSGLTIEILRELNAKVVYDGMDAKKVASDYLEKANLLKK